jgi:hypothetical protein
MIQMNPAPSSRSPQQLWQMLWKSHAPMASLAAFCALLTVFFAAGILLDPRYITGAPAWLKPLKFAISILMYSLSMIWLLSHLPKSHLRTIAANTTIAMLTLELIVIGVQAARGVQSHFNVSTLLDGAIFSTMGLMIAILWGANLLLAIALLRQKIADAPMGLALRAGLVVAVVGMAQAFTMTSPTAQQMAAWQAGGAVTVAGAHTVGSSDGGAGLPVTGWSTQHGDLRVGHFVGLHALQILPLLAWLLASTNLSAVRRSRLIAVAGAYYLSITLLLTWQALRAESLIAPSALTVAVFSALTALALIVAVTFTPRALRSA